MKWRQRSNIHGLLWSKLDGDTYVQVSWLLPSGSSQLNGLEIHIRIMFNEHEKVKLRHCTNKWKNSMENGGMRLVGKDSWNEREVGKSKVGKSQAKFERTDRSWKVSFEVGKFRCSWKVLAEVGKLNLNFPTSARAFQLQLILSNFNRFFPNSLVFFQLCLALSNFSETFQLQTFQLGTFQLLVLSNCPSQLHVSQNGFFSKHRGVSIWFFENFWFQIFSKNPIEISPISIRYFEIFS